MRRAAVLFLALGALSLATPALATEPATPARVVTDMEPTPNRIGKGATVQGPVAISQRKGKGSGFWTSDVPTPERPYRWGYMAMGSVVMALMGLLVFVLIRRAARGRDQRQAG